MAMNVIKYPEYPEYSVECTRARSFDNYWPITQKPRPNQLSDAGFFYTQKGDRVICYCCGGVLRDWEENDDAWEQLALWFGKCQYVLLVKGQKFVDQVKRKYDSMDNNNNNSESSLVGLEHCNNENKKAPLFDGKEVEEEETNDDKLCKICYERERDIAYIPCGHVATCSKCTSSIRLCPICREKLSEVLKIYFP